MRGSEKINETFNQCKRLLKEQYGRSPKWEEVIEFMEFLNLEEV